MPSKPYLPARDALFSQWFTNFSGHVAADYADLGLTSAQAASLSASLADFSNLYAAHLAAQIAAKTAAEAKEAGRDAAEELIRSLVRLVQAHPGLTDAQRETLGITVPKTTKTPIPVPASRPVVTVEEIEEFTHTLRIRDDATHRAARPPGINGAMLYMKVVGPGSPAPVDPEEMDLVSIPSKSTHTQTFSSEDAGKTAYYRLRWVNTKNQPGPWGPQVAATIAA